MKKLIAIALSAVLLFSGCSTVMKSTEDFATVSIVDEQITSGQVMETIKYANLTPTELMIVDHASNSYIAFANKWKKEIPKLDSKTQLFTEFLSDYEELVKQYTSVETIIAKNWASYPGRYQVTLLDYQLRAKKLNAITDKLITANEVIEAGKTALMLAKIAAGILK